MLKRSVLASGISLILTACASQPYEPPQAATPSRAEVEKFAQNALKAVAAASRNANPNWSTGALEIRYKIDHQNRLIDCEAHPLIDTATTARYPYNREIAANMDSLCWRTVFPLLPTESLLMDADQGYSEVRAPLLFHGISSVEASTLRGKEILQEEFFWENLFAGRKFDGVGRAVIAVNLDNDRNVATCRVYTLRSRLRRSDYRHDPKLGHELQNICLSLRNVPTTADWKTSFQIELEYSPWSHKASVSPIR